MLYSQVSSHADNVDNIMLYITGISVVFLIGITVTMIYFVFKYNRKRNANPSDIHGNAALEAIWIIIPTLLVLTMFYFGYMGYKGIKIVPDGAMTIKTIAKMWSWEFEYENGLKTDTLFVPSGVPIALELESIDVNHSLYIPAYRVKQDVIRGKTNILVIDPEKPGSYDIACAEFCGLEHSMMYTKLVVMEMDSFNRWYGKKSISKEETDSE